MPTPQFGNLGSNPTTQDIVDYVHKLRKELDYLLTVLDSNNVARLNTNITVIKSKDGETAIDGPVIKMYDKQATPVLRLQQGYDKITDKFIFQMFNALGIKNIDLDSNGNAVFLGIVKTAETGARLELSSNKLFTYNSSGNKSGMVIGEGSGANFGDVYFYDNGIKVLEFYNNTSNNGYTIRPAGSASLFLGMSGTDTLLEGLYRIKWNNRGTITATTPSGSTGDMIWGTSSQGTGPHIWKNGQWYALSSVAV